MEMGSLGWYYPKDIGSVQAIRPQGETIDMEFHKGGQLLDVHLEKQYFSDFLHSEPSDRVSDSRSCCACGLETSYGVQLNSQDSSKIKYIHPSCHRSYCVSIAELTEKYSDLLILHLM